MKGYFMYGVYMEAIFFPSNTTLGFEVRSKSEASAYEKCFSKVKLHSESIKEDFKIIIILKARVHENISEKYKDLNEK